MPQEKMPQVSDKELMMSNTLMIQPEYRKKFLMELREILPQARRLEACRKFKCQRKYSRQTSKCTGNLESDTCSGSLASTLG
jgi:hypothetical protein